MTPGSARFRPAKPGRPVVLQRFTGGRWRTAEKAVQNKRGSFAFNVPAKRRGEYIRYRALAPRWHGLAAAKSSVERAEPWPRTFEDRFTYRGLDLTKWNYRSLGVRNPDGDRLCAESSRKSVRVPGDGNAYLRVKKIRDQSYPRKCRHGEYYNANIGTQGLFSLRYGIIAMRTKFQHQRGQHGGIWSQPQTVSLVRGNPRVSGAEIDIVEYFGDGFRKGGLGHFVFWQGDDGPVKIGGIVDSRHLLGKGKTWSNSYHVYSVEWTPSRYTFRVDGYPVWSTKRGVSRVRQYIILSLLTSGWELPDLRVGKLNPMTVDWVRAWQRP
jgi:beta-glucanase (GH16 family)